MGKFKLDKQGIRKIQTMLEHQVATVQKNCGRQAYDYLVKFGYHGEYPPMPFESDTGGGWSYYYVVNWNCAINEIDESIVAPVRNAEKEDLMLYKNMHRGVTYYDKVTDKLEFGNTITVTNSVWYGKWLNEGGFLEETFLKTSHPNCFIEGCLDFIRTCVKKTISSTKRNCPDI